MSRILQMSAKAITSLDSSHRPLDSRSLWWLYWLAWIPLAGVYYLTAPSWLSAYRATVVGLFNVLPAAILGTAVIRRYWKRTDVPTGTSLLTELSVLFAFAAAAALATEMLFATHRFLEEGIFAPYMFRAGRTVWRILDRLLIYGLLAALVTTVQMKLRLKEEENRALRAAALRKEAEFKALCAQLKPHFLFNSLQSLIVLSRNDPGKVEDGLAQMGDLLRSSLRAQDRDTEEVTLNQELEIVESYLSLERLRLCERLSVQLEIDPRAQPCRLPVLTLQPLVENAINHSIAPRVGGGKLWISARIRDRRLELEVRDDGSGASESAIQKSNGLGLRLVRRRLRTLYGDLASLSFEFDRQRSFAVRVALPMRPTRTLQPAPRRASPRAVAS